MVSNHLQECRSATQAQGGNPISMRERSPVIQEDRFDDEELIQRSRLEPPG